MKIFRYKVCMIALLSFFGFLFIVPISVSADRSPDNCSGSGLQINLFADHSEVHIGDIISYSITVSNGTGVGPIVCDASNITASLITPDGNAHPITLLRTTLTNKQVDDYSNIVTYTARFEDVKSDGTMTATVRGSGTIHQNDTNSVGGSEQGLNTTVIVDIPPDPPPVIPIITPPPTVPIIDPPAPPPVVTPPSPQGSSSSGGCAYGFNFELGRCNYTAIVPLIVATASIPIIYTSPSPQLPDAGFGPNEASFPWWVLIFAIIFLSSVAISKKTYEYVINNK